MFITNRQTNKCKIIRKHNEEDEEESVVDELSLDAHFVVVTFISVVIVFCNFACFCCFVGLKVQLAFVYKKIDGWMDDSNEKLYVCAYALACMLMSIYIYKYCGGGYILQVTYLA